MITDVCQRWNKRKSSYRPAGELGRVNPSDYEVAPIDGDGSDTLVKAFVEEHHYSGSMPSAKQRIGLYRRDKMVGVAVFSVPPQITVLDRLPCPRVESVELGRLVLLETEAANTETWFIAQAFALLRRRGFAGVISFADPMARRDAAGVVTMPGHVGTIYQATNAVYASRSVPRTLRMFPSGQVFSPRTISKIRKRDKGWRYGVAQLVEAGAVEPADLSVEGLRAWLGVEVRRITKPVRHPGNHRYLFGLTPACKRHLPASLPYPKIGRREVEL